MSIPKSAVIIAIAVAALNATSLTANAGEPGVIYQIKESGTPGTKCTVVTGPNTGKTGTYGDDANRSCCQKPMTDGEEAPGNEWCTECKTGEGESTGACKDKTRTIVSDHFDALGDRTIVVDGYYELPDGRTVHGITVLPADLQSRPMTTSYPVDVESTDDLRKSPDAIDKMIGESVEASARTRKKIDGKRK